MIEQISDVAFELLDWAMSHLWAAGPPPRWAYAMGWAFVGAGAATLVFLAGAVWGSDRHTPAPPEPPAGALDATAVLPRVAHPAPRHRRAARFPLPRRAATTRALSGRSTRSITYAPGKAAARR